MKTIENVKIIEDGRSGAPVNVTVDNGIITRVEKSGCANSDRYLTRGFTDIHTHGAAGHDVSELTPEALSAVGEYLLKNGITAYLPTFVATPLQKLGLQLDALKTLAKNADGAKILGAHIEGPYISIKKKGAQPAENIVSVFDESDCTFFQKHKDILKIVTLCPAVENADKLVKCLTECGIMSEAGHDDSLDYQIEKCIAEGLTGVTHLYCASSSTRRVIGSFVKYLGLCEIALLDDNLYTEVIADGMHVPEKLFKLIYKCKGYEKVILVSDSLSPAGAPFGDYLLGGNIKIYSDEKAAYLKDGTSLAGSVTNIAKMLKNVVSYGMPLEKAVYTVTEAPEKYLDIHEKNKLEKGKEATFNVLDSTGRVLETYLCGNKV